MDVPGAGAAPLPFINGEDPIYTILGDTDAAIQAMLNAVPAGGGLIFLGSRNYAINNTLNFAQSGTVIFGNGESTIFDNSVALPGDAVDVTGMTDCAIMNIAFHETVIPTRYINLNGSHRFTLENVLFLGCSRDLVREIADSDNVHIRGCVFITIGPNGTYIIRNDVANMWNIANNIFIVDTGVKTAHLATMQAHVFGNVIMEINGGACAIRAVHVRGGSTLIGNALFCANTNELIETVNDQLIAGNVANSAARFVDIPNLRQENLVIGNVANRQVLMQAGSPRNAVHGNRVQAVNLSGSVSSVESANVVG